MLVRCDPLVDTRFLGLTCLPLWGKLFQLSAQCGMMLLLDCAVAGMTPLAASNNRETHKSILRHSSSFTIPFFFLFSHLGIYLSGYHLFTTIASILAQTAPYSMKEASNPQSKSHGDTHRSSRQPDSNPVPVNGHSPGLESAKPTNGKNPTTSLDGKPDGIGLGLTSAQSAPTSGAHSRSDGSAVNTPPVAQPGSVVGTDAEKQDQEQKDKEKKPIMQRFWLTAKAVLLSSKINVLLIFVPVGIVVAQFHSLSPAIIFAMNAVAIVPLAGLLSFATESVAHRLGDSLGALLNVTFGNAVELIIL